jgi:hypothetical protein
MFRHIFNGAFITLFKNWLNDLISSNKTEI